MINLRYYFFICIAFVLFLTLLLTYLISIQIFVTILKKKNFVLTSNTNKISNDNINHAFLIQWSLYED